ncbi:MAG: TM0106 family RecB-like putative nuclease [bacterium]
MKKKNQEIRITATSFYQYSKCPAWPWHEAFSDAKLRAPVSAMTEKLWKDGLLHEAEMVALKSKKASMVEIKHEGDLEDQAKMTLKHMKDGAGLIYHGVLMDGNYVGIPDLLERVDGTSDLGDWMYVPCDIKRSSHFEEVHRLQLCFYSELLKKAQGVMPERAYIIDATGATHELVVADYEEKYHLKLKEVEELLSGEKPEPHLYGSCKQSPYFKQCILDAEGEDDVALIYKIRADEREALLKGGYGKLKKLAGANLGKLKAKVPSITQPRLERLRLQAEALRDKKAVIVEKYNFPKAKTEIYFDMESDPLRSVHYLFGCLVVRNGKSEFKPFLAKKPSGEEKAWKEFQAFIGRYKNLAIYHYGWYEIIVIKELTEKYGITKTAARVLGNREIMIDVLPIVSRSVLFPVYFYSLKDIAKFLGFKWRSSDASGANSIAWYHDWLEKKDKKILQKIVDYNEDDVLATRHLVEWMKTAK